MNHRYDHNCCCMECTEEERRLANLDPKPREDHSQELREARESQDYMLRLQVVTVSK